MKKLKKPTQSTTAIISRMGMSKHGKKGTPPNEKHFTGTKIGKTVRRKGSSRKERKLKNKNSKHVNKYKP